MARHKQQEPLPDDIAQMTVAECKAEEQRMRDSGDFERAIDERDRWQAAAEAWRKRTHQLTQRQIEIMQAELAKQED